MSADETSAKNGDIDRDIGGRWRIPDLSIPDFGEMTLFIPPILRYPYRTVLRQVG
jgi:hypothetical protein